MRKNSTLVRRGAAAAALAMLTSAGGLRASHHDWPGWSLAAPVAAVNDPTSAEGCPIESRDGLLAAAINSTVVAGENPTVGSTVWLPAESVAPGR